jgi:hypothetical protein
MIEVMVQLELFYSEFYFMAVRIMDNYVIFNFIYNLFFKPLV